MVILDINGNPQRKNSFFLASGMSCYMYYEESALLFTFLAKNTDDSRCSSVNYRLTNVTFMTVSSSILLPSWPYGGATDIIFPIQIGHRHSDLSDAYSTYFD